jgi:hypothetical protein
MAIRDRIRTGGIAALVAAFGCGFGGNADSALAAEMTPSANAAKWGGHLDIGGRFGSR